RAAGPPAGAREPVGHPARARRHDRDPLRRRCRRGLGSPPPPQGRGRLRDPRAPDREARPMTATGAESPTDQRTPTDGNRLRRLDLRGATDPTVRAARDALIRRGALPDPEVRAAARAILAEVRAGGDAAVRAVNGRVGGGLADGRLVLEPDELRAARDRLAGPLRAALESMIANIRRFAETQRPASTRIVVARGIEIERRWQPLDRVGAYVPGGSAAYPSSLVMCAVPARVAGVGTLVVASPADQTGVVDPVVLGAAGLLDVDALVVAGGAQAIGAL